MAQPKKGQLMQFMFPLVDKTDFATIESAITASNLNNVGTKKFYGLNHGTSTAFTSGTISKAATLVRSGVFAITLKTTEANYDFLQVRITHPSCAEQIMNFQLVDYDDSDIMSRLSDVASDLLSYLVGMSGMLSDIRSNVSDLQSDFQSRVPKAVATASRLLLVESTLSDVYSNLSDLKSDFQSRVPKAVATNSQLSDLASDLRSYLAGMSGVLSDVYSNVSDLQSDFQSRVPKAVATASRLLLAESVISDAHSAAAQANSRILLVQSNLSDVESQIDLNASMISDVQSALDSQFAIGQLLNASTMSDLRSAIAAVTITLSPSDISDIASAVLVGFGSSLSDIYSGVQQTNSRVGTAQTDITNIYSLLSTVPTATENASAVLSAAIIAPIHANAKEINDVSLVGDGSAVPWGPA